MNMKAANLGKVLGAFGAVLLLSSPLTLLLTSGSVLVTALKAGVGVAMLGFYFATNYKTFGQLSPGRSSRFFAASALWVVAALGGLVGVNYLAHQKNARFDLTKERLHTLSSPTVATLAVLKDKVHVYGFLPAGHPQYAALVELFQRYRAEAPAKFDYTILDPQRHPDLAAKYQLRQGEGSVVLVRGEDAHAPHTTLAAVSEQELTNALVKLNGADAQKVYFLTGHGEWPLEAAQTAVGDPGSAVSEFRRQLLLEGYAADELNLAGQKEVPRDAGLVVIAGARTPYTAPEAEALRQYLGSGGRMLYFAEVGAEPKLDALLAEYGVQVDPGVVGDTQYNAGNPFVIASLFYGEHDISRPLQQAKLNTAFATARGLTVLRAGMAPGVKAQAVVLTSPYGWVESTPGSDATPSDGEKTGQITLVAASTRDTRGAPDKRFNEARVVVLGDSELLLDANWGHEANRNLVMNALGWATQQVEKVTIRPPDRETSGLEMDAELLNRVRFVSTDLLPLSLLGVGLAIWLSRRNK